MASRYIIPLCNVLVKVTNIMLLHYIYFLNIEFHGTFFSRISPLLGICVASLSFDVIGVFSYILCLDFI